jgi:hypothetical protein
VPLPQLPQLTGPKSFQAESDPPAFRFGDQPFGVREGRESLYHGTTVLMPERIEAMGADEVPEDFIWEGSKDLFNRVGRAGSSGAIAPRRDLLKIAEGISSVRGTITP